LERGRSKKRGGEAPPLKTTSPFPLIRGRGIKWGWGYQIKLKGVFKRG